MSTERTEDQTRRGPTVQPLQPSDLAGVIGVISRGMRDNPVHVAAFGPDPHRREQRLHHLFSSVMPVLGLPFLAARDDNGTVVGLLGMAPPGRCQPTAKQRLRLSRSLLPLGPKVLYRSGQWMSAWAKQDSTTPHWHLGPVSVDTHLQGTGIGSRLMQAFCEQMDTAGSASYLETDKPQNVRFYERFGFEVVAQQEVVGVPNWFMLRPARAS